jgi:hypothetical protein
LIVVVPSAVTLKLALAALTVVAVPLVAGSLPSVVYVIRFVPDAPASPAVEMPIATGDAVYQPAEQAVPLQSIELDGALKSPCAVKAVPLLVRPALFCARALPLCVVALASNV